jgi:hypothetical protein
MDIPITGMILTSGDTLITTILTMDMVTGTDMATVAAVAMETIITVMGDMDITGAIITDRGQH